MTKEMRPGNVHRGTTLLFCSSIRVRVCFSCPATCNRNAEILLVEISERKKKSNENISSSPSDSDTHTHKHAHIYLCLSSQFGCTAVIECAHKINTAGNDIPSPASSPVSFLTLPSLTFSSLQSIFLYECTQLGYDSVDFMSYIIIWWGEKKVIYDALDFD